MILSILNDVVLYEEGLNQKTLQDAVFYISHADMLIVGGTSLASLYQLLPGYLVRVSYIALRQWPVAR